MKLDICCRHELFQSPSDDGWLAVLLEGSWPTAAASAPRWALDDALDTRFEWIDVDASRLAQQSAESLVIEDAASVGLSVAPAWLNALGLRYYLVKLLRVVVFFTEVQPLKPGDRLRVLAGRNRDDDYVDVLQQLCELAGASCQVEWTERSSLPAPPLPPDEWWRRWADRVRCWFEPRPKADLRPRVVLCGNPRVLDPVCREALAQGCDVWWLYDRLAMKSWWRWRREGVGQLVCNAGQGRQNRLSHRPVTPCQFRGVDLSRAVAGWIESRLEIHGPRQTRLLEQIEVHFHRVRPGALVLDEDATPMTRAAVAVARRHQVGSFVVQHGAPACRFGFSPLAADRMLAWGQASKEQFERWGVPAERILVTGSPPHDELFRRLGNRQDSPTGSTASRPPRILLLATVPPRDERPDSVALHLTGSTYAGMVEAAFAVVSRLTEAELIVKLHPRSPDDPAVRRAQAQYPAVNARVVHVEPLEYWLGEVDCVLSCLSSAGVDATLAGLPVVQLLPAGSGDVLPYADWGLLGSARTADELAPLLSIALAAGRRTPAHPSPNAFGSLDGSAANVVRAALAGIRDQGSGIRGQRAEFRTPRPHMLQSPNLQTLQSRIPNP